MKQIKASAVLVIMVLLFAAFCIGMYFGKQNSGGDFRIVTARASQATQMPTRQPEIPTNTRKVEIATVPTTVPPTTQPGPLNINTATVEQLMTLPNIGPTLAQRIIDYRTVNGPFQSVKELDMVEGIGEKTLEELLELVTVEE